MNCLQINMFSECFQNTGQGCVPEPQTSSYPLWLINLSVTEFHVFLGGGRFLGGDAAGQGNRAKTHRSRTAMSRFDQIVLWGVSTMSGRFL